MKCVLGLTGVSFVKLIYKPKFLYNRVLVYTRSCWSWQTPPPLPQLRFPLRSLSVWLGHFLQLIPRNSVGMSEGEKDKAKCQNGWLLSLEPGMVRYLFFPHCCMIYFASLFVSHFVPFWFFCKRGVGHKKGNLCAYPAIPPSCLSFK